MPCQIDLILLHKGSNDRFIVSIAVAMLVRAIDILMGTHIDLVKAKGHKIIKVKSIKKDSIGGKNYNIREHFL